MNLKVVERRLFALCEQWEQQISPLRLRFAAPSVEMTGWLVEMFAAESTPGLKPYAERL